MQIIGRETKDERRGIPMVGTVATKSPSFNLYKMVVFPESSRPSIRILMSRFARTCLTRENFEPMLIFNYKFNNRNNKEYLLSSMNDKKANRKGTEDIVRQVIITQVGKNGIGE